MIVWANLIDSGSVATPLKGCLGAFLQLNEATDDVIFRFVQKWGPLRVRASWLPGDGVHVCFDGDEGIYAFDAIGESVETYRSLASEFRAVLGLTADIRSGDQP